MNGRRQEQQLRGGEDSARFRDPEDVDAGGHRPALPTIRGCATRHGRSAIKQIASGTAFGGGPRLRYAVGGRLEIKVAQGAKPAKAAAFPARWDAYNRWAAATEAWCGPDFYPPRTTTLFLEDLAQLDHDLHQVHPAAGLSVSFGRRDSVSAPLPRCGKAIADVIQNFRPRWRHGASPPQFDQHAARPVGAGLSEVTPACWSDGRVRFACCYRPMGRLRTAGRG